MFQANLLKSALVACGFLEAVKAITTSNADLAAFPGFEAAMAGAGQYLQWESHKVVTADGYGLTLFKLVGDSLGNPLVATKGPVLLTHGVFSDAVDWLDRINTESMDPAIAVQLALDGHEVWIGCNRGREFSRTHTDANTNPNSSSATIRARYWNFSFEDIGERDLPAMIDAIIAARSSYACDKVSILAHSSGANQALVAALRAPQFASKVDRITSVAPCLQIEQDNFFLPLKDEISVQMFYSLFEEAGVTNLFGADHDEQMSRLREY